MDKFQDPNSSAVRNLYLAPDAPPPPDLFQTSGGETSGPEHSSTPTSADALTTVSTSSAQPSPPALSRGGVQPNSSNARAGPIGARVVHVERVRNLLRVGVVLRPLRLSPVGRIVPLTPGDQAFLYYALLHNLPAAFLQPNPQTRDSASFRKYSRYRHASTLQEAFILGAERKDLKWDFERGFIIFSQ